MKKTVMLAAVALALFLAGCVQTQVQTVVEKDGSGTFTLAYAMSSDLVAGMREFQDLSNLQGGGQRIPTLEEFDRDRIAKACKERGVTLARFDRTTADGKDRIELELEFKDLRDLSGVLSDNFGHEKGWGIFKTADGNYVLRMADLHQGPEADKNPENMVPPDFDLDEDQLKKAEQFSQKMMERMSELDVTMMITVPGRIISHNAQRSEGRTAVWEINSDTFTSASSAMEPEIVFSGKDIAIEAPILTK